MNDEKYIKISVGDFNDLLNKNCIRSSSSPPHVSALSAASPLSRLPQLHPHGTSQTNTADSSASRETAATFLRSMSHSLLTFMVIITLLFSIKPKYLFTNTMSPTFKPIKVGQSNITLVHFIIMIAILCCMID